MLYSNFRTYLYCVGLILLLFLTNRCSDIFEDDLAEEIVQLQSPTNNLETKDTNIKFWWNNIDGASEYNLQVVSPEFSASQSLLLDTLINVNNYSLELLPGKYQWRVSAVNSTSQTPYSLHSLSILIPYDISKTQVKTISPASGDILSNSSVYFSWKATENATEYQVIIKKENWINGTEIYNDEYAVNNFTTTLEDGRYVWGVAAIDSVHKKSTSFSINEFEVDKHGPLSPGLVFPVGDTIIKTQEVTFVWHSVNEPARYQLLIFNDPLSTTPVISKETQDTTLYISLLDEEKYYWKVRALDRNNNIGEYSETSVFSFKKDEILTDKSLNIILPTDGSVIETSLVTFLWDEISGATTYHVQIVSPSFDAPQQLIYDQWVGQNQVKLELDGGEYEARILASDGKTSTNYSIVHFRRSSFSDNTVNIILPKEGALIEQSTVSLLWDKLAGATEYNIQIVTPDFEDPEYFVYDNWIQENHLDLELQGGTYEARILATDGEKNSQYSYVRFNKTLFSEEYAKFSFPRNGAQLLYNEVTLVWDQVEEATKYHLQVVSPDFISSQKLVYDDWLLDNKIQLNLSSGHYQARIYAANDYMETHADTINFEIYYNDLNDRIVELIRPINGISTNSTDITFSWSNISANVKYLFVLKEGDWETGNTIESEELNSASTSFNLAEGNYSWGVKAVDNINGSETNFSIRSFTVDNTPPSTPMLVYPLHQAVVDNYSINFSWNDDSPTANENSYIWELFKVVENNETLIIAEKTENNSKGYSINTGGTYRWRVKSIDLAGNASDYSVKWEFTVPQIANISNDSIRLISPVNNLETEENTQTFWWEKIDGAEKYLFQIVSPSFSNVEVLIEDTELTDNKISLTLQPGIYQWRIKGINSKYQTGFTTNTLIISQ